MEVTGSASEVEVLEGVKSLSSSSWTSGREKSRKFPAVVVSGSWERLGQGRGGESAAVLTLRGGGLGGRPWFTGYEDTTDEEEKYGEYDGSEYDQEEEEERVETETGEEEGEGGEERARRSEDIEAVGESDGDDRRGDVGGGRGTTRTTGDDEGREAHGGGGVDGIQEAGSSSADEGGWGSRRGGSTLGERREREGNDSKDKIGDDGSRSPGVDGGGVAEKRNMEEGGEARKGEGKDVDLYARTVARRKGMATMFRVVQRALLRAAFLLVAFQVLPWLKNSMLAQWLLIGSLVLQTATELAAAFGAARGPAGKGDGEEASGTPGRGGGAGTPASSAGLVGGLMRAVSPENERKQHLDFERLNCLFDKDVEALKAAGQDGNKDLAAAKPKEGEKGKGDGTKGGMKSSRRRSRRSADHGGGGGKGGREGEKEEEEEEQEEEEEKAEGERGRGDGTVVLLLESGGGEVTAYGLAAAKLARLKDKGFRLTICVDKVAASGGYMMACIADWLVAAPFAMLGSIGVVGGIPNFNKALKKAGVEYYHFTAGQHKSLVGPFQEVTKSNQAMQQKQIDSIHSAFKRHVSRYRPSVDMESVGTGEVWLGLDAIENRLVDEIQQQAGLGTDHLALLPASPRGYAPGLVFEGCAGLTSDAATGVWPSSGSSNSHPGDVVPGERGGGWREGHRGGGGGGCFSSFLAVAAAAVVVITPRLFLVGARGCSDSSCGGYPPSV
eukprot:jgi/Undpi1/12958/HiC_scaffold_7.g02624.m1